MVTVESDKWDEFIGWARRFYELGDFDEQERNYKLEVAETLREVRDTLLRGGPWQPLLRKAFGPPNNITSWRTHGAFLTWADAHPDFAAKALQVLWSAEGSAPERIRAFLAHVPLEEVPGPGSRLNLAAFLHAAVSAENFPVYKETAFFRGFDLTRYPRPPKDADEARVYEHALDFLDLLSKEASNRGLNLRDRLDAQGVLWSVAMSTIPVKGFSRKDQEAFRKYLATRVKVVGPVAPVGPSRIDQLAESLLLDVDYLRRIQWLLEDKRQVTLPWPARDRKDLRSAEDCPVLLRPGSGGQRWTAPTSSSAIAMRRSDRAIFSMRAWTRRESRGSGSTPFSLTSQSSSSQRRTASRTSLSIG
jgi:hypothetical protein